jgi:hypothetical protein
MNPDGKKILKGNKKVPNYNSDIEVDIGSENAKKYEVISKTIPEPTPYDGGTITWFNAYGVVDSTTKAPAKVNYTVVLSELPAGKKKLFALVNNTPRELEFKTTGSGKIKFTWDEGDPPIGIWP